MLKKVKQNKRMKWIDSRYARPYKTRLFIKKCQLAQVAAIGLNRHNAIVSSMRKADKPIKLAENAMRTFAEVVNKMIVPVRGRATKQETFYD